MLANDTVGKIDQELIIVTDLGSRCIEWIAATTAGPFGVPDPEVQNPTLVWISAGCPMMIRKLEPEIHETHAHGDE